MFCWLGSVWVLFGFGLGSLWVRFGLVWVKCGVGGVLVRFWVQFGFGFGFGLNLGFELGLGTV